MGDAVFNDYTKFDLHWTPGAPLEGDLIEALTASRIALFDAGLIGWDAAQGISYGNVSARWGASQDFIISGTGTGQQRRLEPRHYALVTRVDIAANRVWSRGPIRASSESMTHAVLYALDARIKAVTHVHDAELWRRLKGLIPTTCADVAYGTPEIAWELERLYLETDFRTRSVAVMGGHVDGLVAFGCSSADAARKLLTLRWRCRASL